MDLNLASIVKVGLIMAFMLPIFALIASTLPAPPALLMAQNQYVTNNLTTEMNSTSLYIEQHFLLTVSGLNNTLFKGANASFQANPTIFQGFAFLLQGFGTVMGDIVMLPYLDIVSMNMLINGMGFVLPPYALGFIKIGMGLLSGYLIFSLGLLGVSMVEKYNMSSG